MNVATILKAKGHEVESIGPDVTLGDAVRLLGAKRIGAVLVMQGAQLVGILSERDIVKTLAHSGAEALDRKVRDTMTSRLVTCGLNDSVDQLMDMMTEGRFRHLPVMDEGKLVGVISIGDVVKHRIAETVMETEALKLYIANS
tara:strand:+ start:26950 stop:27378 length:429 start_codon:yes stop_codon:yes gene_type:complete